MVQVLPRKPSIKEQLISQLASQFPQAISMLLDKQRETSQLAEEDKRLEELGYNLKGIKSPRARELLLQSQIKSTEDPFKDLRKPKPEINTKQEEFNPVEAYQNLTPEDRIVFEQKNPQAAASIRREISKQEKASKPATLPGGLGGIPLSPEEANKINQVMKENPNANAEQLELAFINANVAPGRYEKLVESRRRQDEATKPGAEFAKIREKSVSDYVNNALANRESAEELKFTLSEAEKAVKGDIATPGVKAALKNNPYGQLLMGLTPDEALLQATNKKLLEGTKGIFGSKPTEREIFLLLNSMLPSIGKTKEANLISLGFIKKVNDMKLLHSEIVDRLTEGGTKYIPDLERQVNNLIKPFSEKLRDDLKEAHDQQEGQSNNEKIRVKAPDGTIGFMTQENIDKAKANNVIFTPVK